MNRRASLCWSVLACWLITTGGPANSQERRTERPIGSRLLVDLALHDAVLKELDIAPDAAVAADLQKLSETARAGLREKLRQRVADDDNSRNARITRLREVQGEYDAELKKLLTPEQFVRLQQIHWQTLGTSALAEPDVVSALDITKDQQAKMDAVQQEFFTKQRVLLNAAPAAQQGLKEVKEKVQAAVTEWEAGLNKVLTKPQQEKLAKLDNRDKMSPRDINSEPVIKALETTEEQQAEIKKLADELVRKQQQIFAAANENVRNQPVDEERQKKLEDLVVEQDKQAIAILTDDQKSKFAALKGKPFDRRLLQPRKR